MIYLSQILLVFLVTIFHTSENVASHFHWNHTKIELELLQNIMFTLQALGTVTASSSRNKKCHMDFDDWDFLTKFRYRDHSLNIIEWVGLALGFNFNHLPSPSFESVVLLSNGDTKKLWMLGLCTDKMPIDNSLKFESLWFCQF